MRKLFLAWTAGVVVLYGLGYARGWELGGGQRGLIPQNVRQAPGGYRSFYFWQGGK